MGKLKQALIESSANLHDVNAMRKEALQLSKEAVVKLQGTAKHIQSTNSPDPAFYVGLSGEIKRLMMAIDHVDDIIEELKNKTGARF